MRTLMGLHFSPWSKRARWALARRGLTYRWVEHVPVIGEPVLRLRARRLTGKVTVPLLIDDDGTVIGDSTRIAEYAWNSDVSRGRRGAYGAARLGKGDDPCPPRAEPQRT